MNVVPDFEKLAAFKEHFEGFRSMAYKDSGGVWSVGLGSTYNHDKGRKVRKDDIINRATAIRWMAIDSESVIKQANYYIKVQLNVSQSAAICDRVYNTGVGNFLKTKLDEMINANPFDPAIKHQWVGTGLWDRLGHLLWGLGRRRRAEWWLYHTGELKFYWPRWGDV